MLFHGGPYDGRDLSIPPPLARIMRLPRVEELDSFLGSAENDPGVTGLQAWPYVYELDDSIEPPVYRFKGE